MREEHGLRPELLESLVAGRIQTSRGWQLAPRSLLGEGPRWIFPRLRFNRNGDPLTRDADPILNSVYLDVVPACEV